MSASRAPFTNAWVYYGLLALAVALLAATAVLSERAARALRDSTAAVARSHEAIQRVSNLWSLLGDAETWQRGFLITGESWFLEPYQRAVGHIERELDALPRGFADDAAQLARSEALRRAVRDRLAELAELARLRAELGFDAARAQLRADEMAQEAQAPRRLALAMLDAERAVLKARQSALDQDFAETSSTIVVANGLALVAGIIGVAMLRRSRHAWERQRLAEMDAERAERASREKSAFLASMSHEIRTPMNAIFGFTQLLAGHVRDERGRRWLDAITTSGRSLLALIDDILDLSKIEAGRVELRPERTDLRDLIESTLAVFTQMAADKRLTLRAAVDPQVPEALMLDPVRLRQVLFNLIGNAVKYTDRGGVVVRAQVDRDTVLPEHCALTVAVEDTGIGIAPDRLESIFEPFVQGGGAHLDARPGTGLGLTIVRRLAALMGGEIEVRSTIGAGSLFSLRLPRVPCAAPAAAVVAAPEVDFDALPRARVLIVDDVALNRTLLAEYLAGSHHRVALADGGAQALERVATWRPDVVLLDLRMPRLDGRSVLERIRARGEPQPKVIAVTASALAGEVAELAAGFDGFLGKPVTPAQLYAALAAVLPGAPRSPAPAHRADHRPATPPDPAVAAATLRELERQWPRLRDTLAMRETRGFGARLTELGTAAGATTLADYGRRLVAAVDRFDVTAVDSLLHEYPVQIAESGLALPDGETA